MDLRDVAIEVAARGCRGRELSSHDPALQLFPILGLDRPAVVLGPFTFYRGRPITLVFFREAALLAFEPFRVFARTRTSDLHERRGFSAGIDSEAAGDGFGRECDVDLSAFGISLFEEQVHLRAIGRLVAGESDIAVDAREILAHAAAGFKVRIEFLRGWRETVKQRAERFDDAGLVAFAVRVHPGLVIVAREFAKEAHGFDGKNRLGSHGNAAKMC